MRDAVAMNRLEKLIGPARDGHYTLPDEIMTAHSAVARLGEELHRISKAPEVDSSAAAQNSLADDFLKAARTGADSPTGEKVLEARAFADRVDIEILACREAEGRAVSALGTAVTENHDAIIVDHLRPPFEKVIAEAAKNARHLRGAQSAAEAIASEKQRRSWVGLEELVYQYNRIRQGFKIAFDSAGIQFEDGMFLELQDYDTHVSRRNFGGYDLIPDAAPARLAYISTQAKPWLPKPAEYAARWKAYMDSAADRPAVHPAAGVLYGR